MTAGLLVFVVAAAGRVVVLCDDDATLKRVRVALDAAPHESTIGPFRACHGTASTTTLRDKLDRARQSLYRMNFKAAESDLTALTHEAELVALPAGDDLLAEARVLLVWAALDGRAESRARDYATALVHIRPGLHLSPNVYPPHLIAFIEAIDARQRHEGSLEVTTSIAGTPLAVDGLTRCTTPCVLHGLSAGAHRVTLTPTGVAVYTGIVLVGGAARLHVALDPDGRDALVAALARNDIAAIRTLAPEARVILGPGAVGGTTAWVSDADRATAMTLSFSEGTDAETVASAIRARLEATRPVDDEVVRAKPAISTRDHPLALELALLGVVPLTAPQSDAFSGGAMLLARLRGALSTRWALEAQLGYVGLVPKHDAQFGGVGQLAGGVRFAFVRWLVFSAHGGAALTDGHVRPWFDASLAAPLALGGLSLSPSLMYAHVVDRGNTPLAGDAKLLAVGVALAL